MFELGDLSFGDNVRIVASDSTSASGHADRIGVCYGVTTPSVTGVEVVGRTTADVAVNVHFDDEAVEDAWFAPELVAIVDHAAGSRATVGDQAFVKAEGPWWIGWPGLVIMRNMAAVSTRLRARVHGDFPEPGGAQEVVRLLAEASESERIQAAIVLWANGDIGRLLDSVDLAAVDWRDVLVRGGLEHEDWPNRLEAELGPAR